jgi:hypothetical protein
VEPDLIPSSGWGVKARPTRAQDQSLNREPDGVWGSPRVRARVLLTFRIPGGTLCRHTRTPSNELVCARFFALMVSSFLGAGVLS